MGMSEDVHMPRNTKILAVLFVIVGFCFLRVKLLSVGNINESYRVEVTLLEMYSL